MRRIRVAAAVRVLCCGLAGGILAACSHDRGHDAAVSAMWRDMRIDVAGTLVSIGKCGVLVDADGRRYGIVGNLNRYEPGDRLRISGPVAYWSGCGTYSAVRAERVERQN